MSQTLTRSTSLSAHSSQIYRLRSKVLPRSIKKSSFFLKNIPRTSVMYQGSPSVLRRAILQNSRLRQKKYNNFPNEKKRVYISLPEIGEYTNRKFFDLKNFQNFSKSVSNFFHFQKVSMIFFYRSM